jgi:hypothetical protein
MSRGIENCNPGNIRRSRVRYLGELHPSQDTHFKQFESMAWGYRAMFVLLDSYRKRYGLKSLGEMLTRYAPPTENHTALYIESVCDMTGIKADTELDTHSKRVMIPIVAAMSRIENGRIANLQEVEQGWQLTPFAQGS